MPPKIEATYAGRFEIVILEIDMLDSDDMTKPLTLCNGDGLDRTTATGDETSGELVAKLVRYDPVTGDLCIENGLARIILTRNGTIALKARGS